MAHHLKIEDFSRKMQVVNKYRIIFHLFPISIILIFFFLLHKKCHFKISMQIILTFN